MKPMQSIGGAGGVRSVFGKDFQRATHLDGVFFTMVQLPLRQACFKGEEGFSSWGIQNDLQFLLIQYNSYISIGVSIYPHTTPFQSPSLFEDSDAQS